LIVSGKILGALDVQSTDQEAFSDDDISTLQIVADQLAIAIQNARSLSETQEALDSARIAYGDVSREAWEKIIKSQSRVSFVATSPGNVQLNTNASSVDLIKAIETGDVITSSDGLTIGVPIKIRGKAIGALRLKKPDTSSSWTQDETALAISLSEQLSGALESARLYKESQQRAARESLVSDISARISALPRVDTIVRETVQELGQAIGNAKITFSLIDAQVNEDQADGQRSNGHDGNSSSSESSSRD
jgi:GAF domain